MDLPTNIADTAILSGGDGGPGKRRPHRGGAGHRGWERKGEFGRSARLFGAAEGLTDEIGPRGHTYYQTGASLYENTMAEVRSRPGEPAFEERREEGRVMTFEQAAVCATQGHTKPKSAQP